MAAAIAAATNLAWRDAFPGLTGYAVPAIIDQASVIAVSVLSVLLAAGVYLLLSRAFIIATPLYVGGCILTAAVTCVAAFPPVLPDGMPVPDGFPLLTVPMHMAAGLVAALVVPLVALYRIARPR